MSFSCDMSIGLGGGGGGGLPSAILESGCS